MLPHVGLIIAYDGIVEVEDAHMIVALWLLAIQGVIGAFDTLYYHEWRARLPARGAESASELKLHAARDFFYAVLFGTLPWLAWHGRWVLLLVGVLIAEIILTLTRLRRRDRRCGRRLATSTRVNVSRTR